MYIDINLRENDQYQTEIFHNGTIICITSSDLDKTISCIKSIAKNTNEKVYMDSRGFGIAIADAFDMDGIKYNEVEYRKLDLDI